MWFKMNTFEIAVMAAAAVGKLKLTVYHSTVRQPQHPLSQSTFWCQPVGVLTAQLRHYQILVARREKRSEGRREEKRREEKRREEKRREEKRREEKRREERLL